MSGWAKCRFYGGPEDGCEQVVTDDVCTWGFGMHVHHEMPVLWQAIYLRCERSTRFEFSHYELTEAGSRAEGTTR